MYSVICTITLLLSSGAQEVYQLHGMEIDSKSTSDTFYVDFSKDWPKYASGPPVRYVLGNSCSYLDVINGTPVFARTLLKKL